MKIRTILLFLFILACLAPFGEQAAGKKKKAESTPVATEDTKTSPAAANDSGMGMNMGEDMPFKKMSGKKIISNSNGLELIGEVMINSDQMTMWCSSLIYNMVTKIADAHGVPVKILTSDGREAECQHLTYNIAKKSYRLEGGHPFIKQKNAKSGQIIKSYGDLITIDQGPDGKPSLTIESRGGDLSTIDGTGSKTESPGKNKKAGDGSTQKVGSDNLGAIDIKIPEPDRGQ